MDAKGRSRLHVCNGETQAQNRDLWYQSIFLEMAVFFK